MSPRFLILVLRYLKTKLLGFGIGGSIFPQTQAHGCCNEQMSRAVPAEFFMGMTHEIILCYPCLGTDTHSKSRR